MRLVDDRPNVELREGAEGAPIVVLAFPYDPHVVAVVRGIPGRRFDWDRREWWAPVDDWAGVHVADVLDRFPELTTSDEVDAWLAGIERRWVGRVSTARHDGRGWWLLRTRAGQVPEALAEGAIERDDGALLAPFTAAGAAALAEAAGARLDAGARRCLAALDRGEDPPPARLAVSETVDGTFLRLDVLWDPETGAAFEALPGGGEVGRTLPADPWVVEPLDAFLAQHGVAVEGGAATVLRALRAEHDEALESIRASRATSGEPIAATAAVLGGELAPFQWAGVRYVLSARRAFLADEQGLGKTVEALAALEADDAYPAIVVCPASLKLNWEREAHRWLPHRDVAVIHGRAAVPPTAQITILNYEIVAAHREALARIGPRALVIDESHLCKNPQAKRTQAVRRLAAAVPEDGLRLALTGTPVLNHAEELISQLRVIGRLEDFGSGARFARQFRGHLSEERLHWHLRRRCFVRRLKADVLPQLPAKRQVVVPVAIDNEREYRLAEEDVIAWLREQPLDLSTLNARIAATLRAERLAQLGTLQRLAARGKLRAALAWIHDFLASGEPLVVFARHVEFQEATLERFPDALHLLGRDTAADRDATVRAFQEPDGPQLIVCATRVAAQGITLTRASNVAFLELEWTPAMHDQAEDRCHRIGQRDAVTAWYLLAAETIDETMARLIQHKRGLVAAVTDGRRLDGDGLVEQVIRELRGGRPFRHLRRVG
ncbi:MAG: SWI/SNF-related matrix-associated actin-dependent regulator of chromatin subfamily A-like protein 1 [Solirubrobacteraceae bacterium]|jgi:superfamily II DNA or RNA helicase|nr:SWI/SNF-related matrix-associated actin-dependent regulator of chromatin subfamily A-like protein 1 [Solirubrobacteraceae bacterium]